MNEDEHVTARNWKVRVRRTQGSRKMC